MTQNIQDIETLLTEKNICMEFPVEPGIIATIYPNLNGRHEIRVIHSMSQDLDKLTSALYILSDQPLLEAREPLKIKVIEALRRHLRTYYGIQPDPLWTNQ